MEKSKREIEQIILEFLKEHGENYFTCALATCHDNVPRNTPVDARNDGLNMYFVADQGGKVKNIQKNPDVCLAVFIPVGKGYMTNARGLQMWGKAHIVKEDKDPEEFEKGFNTIRLDEISMSLNGKPFPDKAKQTLTIIKIVPQKISYFVSMGEKPEKHIWQKDSE